MAEELLPVEEAALLDIFQVLVRSWVGSVCNKSQVGIFTELFSARYTWLGGLRFGVIGKTSKAGFAPEAGRIFLSNITATGSCPRGATKLFSLIER